MHLLAAFTPTFADHLPGMQLIQSDTASLRGDAEVLYVPATQSMQAASVPELYLPVIQAVQSASALEPTVITLLPALQVMQRSLHCAACVKYFPATQEMHLLSSSTP
jgi:hypothetical protein